MASGSVPMRYLWAILGLAAPAAGGDGVPFRGVHHEASVMHAVAFGQAARFTGVGAAVGF